MDRVEQGQVEVRDRMTGLVVSGEFLLPVVHLPGLLLRADHDFDGGLFNIVVGDGFPAGAGRQKSRFVHKVLKVRSGEAGGGTGDDVEVDVRTQGLVPGVDLQNGLSPLDVRVRDGDLAVKTSGTEQGGVEDIGPVGGGDHDDAEVGGKAVHFHQQLVEGLLSFIVTAAHAGASVAADGVDLIDEDDGGSTLLGLVEQVPDTAGADTDIHFNEVGTGDGEERNVGFSRSSAGQEGLTGTGRAHHEDTLRDAGAQGIELLRVFQEFDDLLEFFLLVVGSCHIGKGGLLLFAALLDPGLSKAHASLGIIHDVGIHAAHEPDDDGGHDEGGEHKR